MKIMRIGIVGIGFIGMRHIDTIGRIHGARVVAVADVNLERAKHVAESIGAEYACQSVDEMLANCEVDVVHNCTPTSLHFEVSAKVIRAGKALYCEKPLALDGCQAREMTALLSEHPVPNGVNLNYRMNALVQELRQRIQTGEEGRCYMVTGCYIQDWMLYPDDTDWRLIPAIGGQSRAISDIGSHLLDSAQFVLGKKITAVYADTLIAIPTRYRYEKKGGTFSTEKGKLIEELQVVNEDAANILLRFEDGTHGMIQVGQVMAGHKNDMMLRFDMEKCTLEWKQEDGDKLYIGHRGEPNQVMFRETSALHPEVGVYSTTPAGHPLGWNDTLLNAISAFYNSMDDGSWKTGNVPYATLKQGEWIMRIIDACLKSAEVQRWVRVEDCQVLERA